MSPGAASQTTPVDYLALGDSYTIGEGVGDDLRWPVQLAALLRADGIAIAHPHIIAQSGWSTDELSAAIDEEQAQGQLLPRYGLVSLLIGVNDQYRGRSLDDYAAEFSRLFERAIDFAGGDPAHMLALSIPDWGSTPFAQASGRDRAQIGEEIDQYNAFAAAKCQQRGVTWVDITDLTRAPQLENLLVSDSLHPSGEMYALWAARIHDKIRL
jgi:lysophospholipase L1-like esterase